MLEPDLRYRLRLAERFNCTLAELGVRLSHAEYVTWSAEDKLRAAESQAAESQANKGMRPRRR